MRDAVFAGARPSNQRAAGTGWQGLAGSKELAVRCIRGHAGDSGSGSACWVTLSAHVFFSPATWDMASCTWFRTDQDATSLKKWHKGWVVVKSLLMPASAEAAGSTNLKCLA